MVKKTFAIILLPLLLAMSGLLTACSKAPPAQMHFALGTLCSINLFEDGNKQLYSRITSLLDEIDITMTAYPSEEWALLFGLAAVNAQAGTVQAGGGILGIGDAFFDVLEKALYYAELSNGAFDPTVGPLVKLWGIGTEEEKIPDYNAIAAALELVNWRDVEIDRRRRAVSLRRKGMALDFGAIAKGHAADAAAQIAREANVKRAIFDFGGNIVTLGWREQKKGKEPLPWRVGVQNPLADRGAYIGVLQVHDKSVVTSGVYERFFELDGRRYHHILSTRNGYPVDNGLLAVTIVADHSTDADALSTTVFALGYEQGKALIDSIPDIEALFIFDDHSVVITDGLAEIFELTDNTFTMK